MSRTQGTSSLHFNGRQIGDVCRNRGPQTNYREEEEEEAGPSAPTMMSLLGSLKLKRSSDKNFKFPPNTEISN